MPGPSGEAGHTGRYGAGLYGAGRHGAEQHGPERYAAVLETGSDLGDLVEAARSGDRRAAETLIAAHMPLLYRVVGRALEGHADVDDVVQETILRAHRDLPNLRTPGSFRSWLLAIAMHRISSRMQSWQQERVRSAPLDEADQVSDPGADFTGVTLLRLTMSEQRRQVAQAARWLDPGDQELAALWWRETTGDLTRAEVVTALGVEPAHARVRIQRMRQQLELSRFLVAALDAEPRCARLDALTDGWDGVPRPRWRKRFARHLRDCPVCGPVRSGFVPLERLVAGASLVPLPAGAGLAGLSGGAATAVGSGAAAGAFGWMGQIVGAKAVAVLAIGATVSGGVYLALPDGPVRPPAVVSSAPALAEPEPTDNGAPEDETQPGRAPAGGDPAPSPSASPSATGPVKAVLRPATQPDTVVSLDENALVTADDRPATVLTVVPGIADGSCLSFVTPDDRYMRHAQFHLIVGKDEESDLFRADATFCPQAGAGPGTVRLASLNYPDRFVRVRDGKLELDPGETTPEYERESTFTLTTP